MNLLRAGRTQARARFASGPARGAARPARARGRGGVRCQKAQLRALPESEGVPGSAQEASVSAVSRARGAHCLGGPAWMRGSISASAEPRGGWGARQVCSGHRAPGLEEPLVGKPRAGALAAESWPARPRGSPSLSWGGAVQQISQRAPPIPFPSFLLGLAPASHPAAGASHSPHGPRSEGARLQQRLPVSRGGEIARRQRGSPQENWRGTARLLLLPRIYCQSRLQKIVWQNPEMIPSSVHSRKEDTAQPRTRAANPHPPTERKEARKVSEGAWDS